MPPQPSSILILRNARASAAETTRVLIVRRVFPANSSKIKVTPLSTPGVPFGLQRPSLRV